MLESTTTIINMNCRDPLGRSALLMAIDNENMEMLELLLENKVKYYLLITIFLMLCFHSSFYIEKKEYDEVDSNIFPISIIIAGWNKRCIASRNQRAVCWSCWSPAWSRGEHSCWGWALVLGVSVRGGGCVQQRHHAPGPGRAHQQLRDHQDSVGPRSLTALSSSSSVWLWRVFRSVCGVKSSFFYLSEKQKPPPSSRLFTLILILCKNNVVCAAFSSTND